MKNNKITQKLIDILTENRATQISELDVRSLTDMADTIIICSASSQRHANALTEKARITAKNMGMTVMGIEGQASNDGWVLIDLCYTIIHIMLPENRAFYCLEKLWAMPGETRQ